MPLTLEYMSWFYSRYIFFFLILFISPSSFNFPFISYLWKLEKQKKNERKLLKIKSCRKKSFFPCHVLRLQDGFRTSVYLFVLSFVRTSFNVNFLERRRITIVFVNCLCTLFILHFPGHEDVCSQSILTNFCSNEYLPFLFFSFFPLPLLKITRKKLTSLPTIF